MTHPDAVALTADEECPVCGFIRGQLSICACEYMRSLASNWPAVLAANLAIGAGLCRAFYRGFAAGNGPRPLVWTPGCQRRAL
jgi:hypothetical protein